jgi:hypothetical protein
MRRELEINWDKSQRGRMWASGSIPHAPPPNSPRKQNRCKTAGFKFKLDKRCEEMKSVFDLWIGVMLLVTALIIQGVSFITIPDDGHNKERLLSSVLIVPALVLFLRMIWKSRKSN